MASLKSLIAACIQSYTIYNKDSICLLDSSCYTDERFYFPNMCHICHCFGENAVNLKMCGACGMISYCCKEHQVKDWPSHKQFCKVICQMKKDLKVDNIFQELKSTLGTKSLLSTVKNFQDKLNYHNLLGDFCANLYVKAFMLLQRKLNKVEYEMFQFPRICNVCSESKPELLTNCRKCPQATFCKEHLNDPNHEIECKKIMTCFMIQSNKKINETVSILSDSKILDTFWYYNNETFPSSMLQFFETRLSTIDFDILKSINVTFTEEMKLIYNAALSVLYSVSFTLIFAIKKLCLNLSSMVIHVVGWDAHAAAFTNCEVMFHFLPQLRELEFIFIGSGENSRLMKMMSIPSLKEERKLTFETKNVLYHEYCKEENFLKPDIIACFNGSFNTDKTLENSMKCLKEAQCPLLVTSEHRLDAIVNKEFIDTEFPFAKCVYNDYNPFTSLAYKRDNILLPITARNQFMFLYEFL